MSVVVVAHLSDAHLKTADDTLVGRALALAQTIVAEIDASVTGCVVAFTGDAVDKGFEAGFGVAKQFFERLISDIKRLAKLQPIVLSVPGNHDVVRPKDSSLRDVAIGSLSGDTSVERPKKALEEVILGSMNSYFTFADSVAPGASPTSDHPYYTFLDKNFDGTLFRFHLLNSAWMCNTGQSPGDLLFPVNEIHPPNNGKAPDYEITLLHHPFGWFKQPEVMRPLRDAVEAVSDMILTGHEHVGRLTTTSVHGGGDFEYREGEALQEGDKGQISGFHLLRLDFQNQRQIVTTYKWCTATKAYIRAFEPVESALGRNRRRAAQPYRLRPSFAARLDDPELPVFHSKQGKLRLSDFYTYPDLKPIGKETAKSRVRAEQVVETISRAPRSLVFGPDRCGKTSLAKRLYADLHKAGQLPLLLHGSRLKNARPDRVGHLLEGLVDEQYEALRAEAYWQTPPAARVLILDDLHDAPADTNRRAKLLAEFERRFQHIVIIGADELYYEELICVDADERKSNTLWGYDLYRILPFGYVRCEKFVRNWVGLGHTKPDELEETVTQINGLLTQFLRTNLIPQYPWVVMIIVQQADSPEPLHAENGSYGYLLQALITAALAKSRLKLPINGKYAWLGEFANELYTRNLTDLSDDDARSVHERYRLEYGVPNLDYKEVRDDLAAAGVLRVDGDQVTFRQPYTYCYFVAWHLAQRLHANDPTARADVRRLCKDLYHEDGANVLVFLAHLTTSHVVLEEMTSTAAELFAGSSETDFVNDVEPINNLYKKVQSLILPHGDPQQHKRALHDQQDEKQADRNANAPPGRGVILRPSAEETAAKEARFGKVMEVVTATRTIEILGQVLRNEATARKVPALLQITKQVFSLGRRLLGFIFSLGSPQLEQAIANLEEHYRHRMPKANVEELVEEVSRHLFNLYAFSAFGLIKHIALAVGERNLREVFRQLVDADPNLANRIYKLSIDLETASKLPLRDVEILNDELTGTVKIEGGTTIYNNLAHTVVRALVVDYLYLNHVPYPQVQALCSKLKIEVPPAVVDPANKRLPPRKK